MTKALRSLKTQSKDTKALQTLGNTKTLTEKAEMHTEVELFEMHSMLLNGLLEDADAWEAEAILAVHHGADCT